MPNEASGANGRPTDQHGRRPWRVEGAPPSPGEGGPETPKRRPLWLRFGWVLVVLLVLNWIISSAMLGPASRTSVSYSFFLSQVKAANVAEVTSTSDTIEGTFKSKASYTPVGQKKAEDVDRFTTQRPSFAEDNLFAMLQANNVPVNANPPDKPAPVWHRFLSASVPRCCLSVCCSG